MSIALANLNININANTGQAQQGLRDVGRAAQDSMFTSQAAVEEFRNSLERTSQNLAEAARSMGVSMDGARDHITTGSTESQEAIKRMADAANDVSFESMGERAKNAFGESFRQGYQEAETWWEKTKESMASKAKMIAIGIGVAIIGGVVAAVYTAYKVVSSTIGFIAGLFTGESYKSANIDALIAANNQVKELQAALGVSAQHAGALGDAMGRLGVDKADYTQVYKNTAAAMRENAEELDRLGVKTRDANGEFLKTGEVIQNAKDVLDTYTDGYDRNKAAVAIGLGTYQQLVDVLKVTEAQTAKSSERMDDYMIAIGPKTQAAVAAYEQAMREFDSEMQKTAMGFKRAIADNIMPALTGLATWFKDGWPFAVRAFRGSLATITSMMYGLKMVADILVDTFKGAFMAVYEFTVGIAAAATKAGQGDFSGAAEAFTRGWDLAKTQVGMTWDEMLADAQKNRAAMELAWGTADWTGDAPDKPKGGAKAWVPAPKKEPEQQSIRVIQEKQSAYEKYSDELERMLLKSEQNEFASMRLRAEQLAQKEGITDLTKAYQLINKIQASESTKAVEAYVERLRQETQAYAEQTEALALSALAQEQFAFAQQKRLAAEQAVQAAIKSGKPLTDEAIADLRSQTEATISLAHAQMQQRNTKVRAAEFGSQKALREYQENATNAAGNAERLINGSLSKIEDAFVNFVKTGKLSFKDLFTFMADEFLRNQIRMTIAQIGKDSGGSPWGGIVKGLIGMFTGVNVNGAGTTNYVGNPGSTGYTDPNVVAIPGLATGTNYVPYDGMPAILHKGEAVVPKQYNPAAGGVGGGQSISVGAGQVINIGQGMSRSEVFAAINHANAQSEARIKRNMKQGTF